MPYLQDMDLTSVDDNGKTALHWAAAYGNHAIIPLLILLGVQQDVKDRDGNTALDLALVYDHTPAAKALQLDETVNYVVNGIGQTMLHVAYYLGEDDMVIKLLEAGADDSIVDRMGKKPIDYLEDAEDDTEDAPSFELSNTEDDADENDWDDDAATVIVSDDHITEVLGALDYSEHDPGTAAAA